MNYIFSVKICNFQLTYLNSFINKKNNKSKSKEIFLKSIILNGVKNE